jgi:hypothetical protein
VPTLLFLIDAFVATRTLAHQGGWDEILFVAAPIAVVVGLLRVAGARSRRIQSGRDGGAPGPTGDGDDSGGTGVNR